jgi:hypothetical protein
MTSTTVEIEGFGPVTFKPLGKLAMQRVREAAHRGAPRGYGSDEMDLRGFDPEKVRRLREDALLVASYVTDPKLSNEELQRTFAGREHLIGEIAEAIRQASWPNR